MNDSSVAAPISLASQVLDTAHGMEARLESALERVGLSLAKLGVLSKLAEAGEPLALGCLAGLCACVRSNMTQLVDRLEADKLVERVNDPNDRRSVRAVLTGLGRERQAEGARILEEAERELFAGMGETDRAALVRLLGLLAEKAS
ncbi:MAG TPA: MarR family transcriptional regulator [Thermoanaerobaculia bacterium]|jgi:DNA-binding MarR family transcriptional regulator|nr:MarR family transcriptional regulator [Thermoanaerobaculia bacterium]